MNIKICNNCKSFWSLAIGRCDCDSTTFTITDKSNGIFAKDLLANIGKKTSKIRSPKREPKPFKSGLKINTIKGLVMHPILNIVAYTFHEDESYVAAKYCKILD